MMSIVKNSVSFLGNRRQVKHLRETIDALEKWFDSPLGQQLLAEEQKVLEEALNCMFGYHLMQLSVSRKVNLHEGSRINHCFSMGADPSSVVTGMGGALGAYSDFDALPLEDESIDVTVLHHVLEFSDNPHQVLKEASRVTIPRGYIIVIGFNPISTMGLIKPFAQLLGKNPIWKRQSLRKSRVSDWLQFLNCNTLRTQSAHYNLPLQNRQYLDSSSGLNRLLKLWSMPFGNFYCLIARKDRVSLRPLRPDWSRHTGFRSAKPAISARSAARLAIVKPKDRNRF